MALLCVCLVAPPPIPAQSRPVEALAVQGVGPLSPEPPLVEGIAPGAPVTPGVPGTTVVVDPPVPVVAIRVRVPAAATAGQELTYHIFVDNLSKSTAHRVEVRASVTPTAKVLRTTPDAEKRESDKKEPELHWSFGTLEGGVSKEITLVVVPDGTGEVRTTARVAFEHGQSVVTHLNKPSLRVHQSGPKEGAVNSTLRFVLDVVNDGSAVAENLVVEDALPEGWKFADSKPATKGESPLSWTFPSLAAGQRQRIEYQVIPTKAGTFSNTATARAEGGLKNSATTTVVVGEPKLSVTQTGPKLGVPGSPLMYTITVKNTGTVAATNVEIRDRIPRNVQPQTQVPLIEFLNATNNGRYERPDVHWRLGTVPAGESRSVQLTLRVNQFGKLFNLAKVQADQALFDQAQVLTILVDPSRRLTLDLEKSREAPQLGDDVVYTVRVINPSNVALNGVALTVSASANVSFGEASGATRGKPDPLKPLIQFEALPPLPPGEMREYTISAKVRDKGEVQFQARADVTPPAAGFPVLVDDPPKPPARP